MFRRIHTMNEGEHNWVAECGNCTLERKFDALIHIVDRDVDQMNELPSQIRRDYTFVREIETKDPTKPILAVKRYLPQSAPQTICLFMRDRHPSALVRPIPFNPLRVALSPAETAQIERSLQ